jgi:hypothetical protein
MVCRLRGFILQQQRAGIMERAELTLQTPTHEVENKNKEKKSKHNEEVRKYSSGR